MFGEPHVVVACIPGDARIVSKVFSYDRSEFDTGSPMLAAGAIIQMTLKERFPGSIATIAVPKNPHATPKCSIRAAASDGTVWGAEWGFVPMSSLSAPVYLKEVPKQGRRRICLVLECGGRNIDPTLVMASRKERDFFPIVPGVEHWVPVGEYSLTTEAEIPLLTEMVEKETVVVPPGDTCLRATIRLQDQFGRVELVPTLPHGEHDSELYIGYQHERASLAVTVVWRPGDDPLVYWLPAGLLRVSAGAHGYRSLEKQVMLLGTERLQRVIVPLEYQ